MTTRKREVRAEYNNRIKVERDNDSPTTASVTVWIADTENQLSAWVTSAGLRRLASACTAVADGMEKDQP